MTRKILMGFFVSLVSVSSGAQAKNITHGASFVAFNAGEAQNVDYLTTGARTNLSGGQSLISAVTRGPAPTGGFQTFTLTGLHTGTQTSFCTLEVVKSDGTLLASQDLSAVNVAGAWSKSTNVTYNLLLNDAQVSVVCTIPGSFQGVLLGITSSP